MPNLKTYKPFAYQTVKTGVPLSMRALGITLGCAFGSSALGFFAFELIGGINMSDPYCNPDPKTSYLFGSLPGFILGGLIGGKIGNNIGNTLVVDAENEKINNNIELKKQKYSTFKYIEREDKRLERVYDYKAKLTNGKRGLLSIYNNKKLLLVNKPFQAAAIPAFALSYIVYRKFCNLM